MSTTHGGPRILGTVSAANGEGVIRVENRFDTTVDDLWSALTDRAASPTGWATWRATCAWAVSFARTSS